MHPYTSENTLVLAKRLHNSKRSYLLVNPLQAKHLPVSPAESLRMMDCLGRQLAARYPGARLVIGFAETATAIGAAVAACIGEGCIYIHTTREACPEAAEWVCFCEEHSHAVDQRLCGERLAEWIAASPQIIFVDDELSTGKTLINIVNQLREQYPMMKGKEIVAASILNRLAEEHTQRLTDAGIRSECLVKLPHEDLSAAVAGYEVSPAEEAPDTAEFPPVIHSSTTYPDPRFGMPIGEYTAFCRQLAQESAARLPLPEQGSVLVLGTEECMYPALVLGKLLEERGLAVRCHATTRSPIGICQTEGYPIRSGYRLHSVYEQARTTFLYNLQAYDAAVIVTDTPLDGGMGFSELTAVLRAHGCKNISIVNGRNHVQHL